MKFFLEQCLFSVIRATRDIDAEVIVVDNASTDGSREYLLSVFGKAATGRAALDRISFIWNEENVGFGKANNQALAMANGKYVLFLNPDTIIPEDSLNTCIEFMDSSPRAGALGVRMVDGGGRFLKESKRAYPTLFTSFFKLCGLAAVFPTSKVFAQYHLGHLDPAQIHEVDVLAGAFMMVRKDLLDKTGGFDEDFFMYGEDIDLSYRIQKLGFKNFYFPETTIVHFKGESTKRGSLNYVRMFYQAMSIFVKKHYSGLAANIYRFGINIAIWFRAALAAASGFLRHSGLPLVDAINTLISFIAATLLWNRLVKPDIVYEKNLLMVAFPSFTLIFILVSFYAGLYDKHQKKGRVIISTLISVLIVLALYSLLPEKYRFSRGILLLGSFFSFLLLSLNRLLLRKWGFIEVEEEEKLGTVIVGTQKEFEETVALMQSVEKDQRVLGRIAIEEDSATHLSTISNLDKFIHDVPVREIIFCQGKLSFSEIIHFATEMAPGIRMRIHACGSMSIVGSDSSRSTGTTLSSEGNYAIDSVSARRYKRLMDICISVFLVMGLPIHLLFVSKRANFCRNIYQVVAGRKSWIGYSSHVHQSLPLIREGVIGTNGLPVNSYSNMEEGLVLLDQLYAREYSLNRDLALAVKGYKWLGS